MVWYEWSSHMMYTTFSGWSDAFFPPAQELPARAAEAPVSVRNSWDVFINLSIDRP